VAYLDFLDGVAAYRVGEVLLSVLEPGVEGGGLLGEGKVEVLDLAVLVLESQQHLLPLAAVLQQLVPPGECEAVTQC